MKKLLPLKRILNHKFDRRTALKLLGIGGAAVSLPSCVTSRATDRDLSSLLGDKPLAGLEGQSFSPIDRSLPDVAPRVYSGDQPLRDHRILWDIPGYIKSKGGSIPEPTEKIPLVVIGGGVSGLFSSYFLREHRPVILEQASRFGGNSKGESWRGVDYALGASYFMEQSPDSPIAKLYAELGLDKQWRLKRGSDPVLIHGKRFDGFWNGDTAPKYRPQFIRLRNYFLDTLSSRNGLTYPDIPITSDAARAVVQRLDRENFRQHLEKIARAPLHPHIEAALQFYCWSSFGASMDEVSAAAGMNFYSAELGNAYVTPGGNATVAEVLLQKLVNQLPSSCFRPGSVVFHVEVVADGVIVAYEDSSGNVRSLHAKSAVMACPKFVVKKILKDMEPAREAAIQKLKYRSYLVGNVCLNGHIPDDFYDYYLLDRGPVNRADMRASSIREGATDMVLASYSHPAPDRAVLTLYRGFPYDGGRAELYDPNNYAVFRAQFEKQVIARLLPALRMKASQIVDLRIARWGHPIPVPAPGLIAEGAMEMIRKPFRNRVFFIDQDNWMLPAMETGLTEAMQFTPAIHAICQS